jgi:hypothetical protein
VIDPPVDFSTFLGGGGTEVIGGIAVDGDRASYVVGTTTSADFPTASALQDTHAGGINDVFVVKIDAAGTLVFSTYLGGTGTDAADAVAVRGAVYVTGFTDSEDFPTVSPLQAAHGGGGDAFVLKLDTAGSALLYSTYLGGSGKDQGLGIAVDEQGGAYVAGATGSTDLPGPQPPLLAWGGGMSDAFVAKVDATGSSLAYSTYLGGGGDEEATGIALDTGHGAHVTGWTGSADFPTQDPLYGSLSGQEDAFVAKIDGFGTSLVYSTYLGGSGVDRAEAIALDADRAAYVAGWTASTDFPISGAVYPQSAGKVEAFVTKVAPGGSALDYSTFLGGSEDDRALAIALDGRGAAYVTGFTDSPDFPMRLPEDATVDGDDVFLTKLGVRGAIVIFSTYLGGEAFDGGYEIAVDGNRAAHLTGPTHSTAFPTKSPLQAGLAGAPDAFVARLRAPNAAPRVTESLGFSPWPPLPGEEIQFLFDAYDPDGDDLTFSWTFGDGAVAEGLDPTHAYAAEGLYTVRVTMDDGDVPIVSGISVFVATHLTVNSLKTKVNFRKPGRDSFKLECVVDVPEGLDLEGTNLAVWVGDVGGEYEFDAKGKAKTDTGRAKLKQSKKTGEWTAKIKEKRRDFAEPWAKFGLVNEDRKAAEVFLRVAVSYPGFLKAESVPQLYTAKAGKRGKTK